MPVVNRQQSSSRSSIFLKTCWPTATASRGCRPPVTRRQAATFPTSGRPGKFSPPSTCGSGRGRGVGSLGVPTYPRSMHGYTQDKDAYLKRLRRIEGQVRGLQRMVESDTYCIDSLTQGSAVTRAPQAVALGLVEDHLGSCVAQAIEDGGPEAQDKVKEASKAIARLVRS